MSYAGGGNNGSYGDEQVSLHQQEQRAREAQEYGNAGSQSSEQQSGQSGSAQQGGSE